MADLIDLLGAATRAFRALFVVVLVVAAALALIVWLERTRRLNAFGALARSARRMGELFVAPVEGRVVRMGGTHTSAPWWWLFAVLVMGALAVGVVGFVQNELVRVDFALRAGPRGLVALAVVWVFTVLQLAVLARVVMSWLGGNYTRFGRAVWWLTEWMLGPLRRILPNFGSFDISPLVAWFALGLLQGMVSRLL